MLVGSSSRSESPGRDPCAKPHQSPLRIVTLEEVKVVAIPHFYRVGGQLGYSGPALKQYVDKKWEETQQIWEKERRETLYEFFRARGYKAGLRGRELATWVLQQIEDTA